MTLPNKPPEDFSREERIFFNSAISARVRPPAAKRASILAITFLSWYFIMALAIKPSGPINNVTPFAIVRLIPVRPAASLMKSCVDRLSQSTGGLGGSVVGLSLSLLTSARAATTGAASASPATTLPVSPSGAVDGSYIV